MQSMILLDYGKRKCKRLKKILRVYLVAAAVLLFVTACGKTAPAPSPSPPSHTTQALKWDSAPKMTIDPNKNYEAVFDTSKGKFTMQLFAKDAPITVNNFVFLSKQGYYNNVIFHRIIKTFMIQTGDPTGTGRGGPGYTIQDELQANQKYTYGPGIVAMAKTSQPNSGGSQFFICTGADSSFLNQSPVYPIFGKIISGMDVVQAIADTQVKANPDSGEKSMPAEKVSINKIDIIEK